MTTNEKQLLSQMSIALLDKVPTIAQALDPDQPTARVSRFLDARFDGGVIMLSYRGIDIVAIAPETLRALNDFAVKCGWQCD